MVPRIGATWPMTRWASRIFRTRLLHPRANSARVMGMAIETTEPSETSRMMTAMATPISSAWSEIALLGWLR